MEETEFKRSKVFNVAEMLHYAPDSIVTKSILRCLNGHISAMAFDSNEILNTDISPFDTLIQIIEGKAIISIDNNPYAMEAGQSIIIPAHSRNSIEANGRFKMESTIIKCGYEI